MRCAACGRRCRSPRSASGTKTSRRSPTRRWPLCSGLALQADAGDEGLERAGAVRWQLGEPDQQVLALRRRGELEVHHPAGVGRGCTVLRCASCGALPVRSCRSAPGMLPSVISTLVTVTDLPISSSSPVPDCMFPKSAVAYQSVFQGVAGLSLTASEACPGLSPCPAPFGPNAVTLTGVSDVSCAVAGEDAGFGCAWCAAARPACRAAWCAGRVTAAGEAVACPPDEAR